MSQPVPGVEATATSPADARAPTVPDRQHRWRCGGCGNMTRFDVLRAARSREYWHLDLAGEPRVEEHEVLTEAIISVTCRWCGRADCIEVVSRPGVAADVS